MHEKALRLQSLPVFASAVSRPMPLSTNSNIAGGKWLKGNTISLYLVTHKSRNLEYEKQA